MTTSFTATGTPVSSPVASAVAYTPPGVFPQLPLEVWRQIIGYHPWHFWGLSSNTYFPVTSACNTLVKEYAWQDAQQIGRSEIRRAIAVAEARLSEYLNYWVGRHFVQEEIEYPRPATGGHQYAASIGGDGRWLNIRLNEGYIRNIGYQARDLIEASVAVTFSDADGDGVEDTFTATVGSSVTNAEQVAVYFSSGDRLNSDPVSERWRIQPLSISISGGTITIRGSKYLLVKPIKYEGFSSATLDAQTAGNFVTTIDVYRLYCNPDGTTNDTAQAVLVWETPPYPPWAFCCEDTALSFSTNARDPAAVAYGIARAGIRDARLGEITVGRAVYDSDSGEWIGASWGTCRQPDRVIIRYEAGAKLSSVENTLSQSRLNGRWDEIVARFAAAEMTRRICACDVANQELYRWQFDIARAAGANDEQYRIADKDLSNPLGTKAGAVYAWKRVQDLLITRSVLL